MTISKRPMTMTIPLLSSDRPISARLGGRKLVKGKTSERAASARRGTKKMEKERVFLPPSEFLWDVQYVVVSPSILPPSSPPKLNPRRMTKAPSRPEGMSRDKAMAALGLSKKREGSDLEIAKVTDFSEEDILEAFRRRAEKLDESSGGSRVELMMETHEAYQVLIQALRRGTSPAALPQPRRAATGDIFENMQTIADTFGCGRDSQNCAC